MSTTSFAQSNTLFNPDYNGDGFIGVDDILGALSFYDNVWDGPFANVIYGCTYPLFAEYDALADVDDGSCATLVVAGCMDSSYLEYDASANVDDGSCTTVAVPGCTEPSYLEYDPLANMDDGSCLTSSCDGGPAIYGCTYPWFAEYDASATVDDGSCLSSPCGFAISYQGYNYQTVLIGNQCWFTENLRCENYATGDAIPAVLSASEWSSTMSGAVATSDNLETYGRLYNWHAVNDERGLCPTGWHVPSDGDWTVLTDYLGGQEVAGGAMKTSYGWIEQGPAGTNSSGLSCLPGGNRNSSGDFSSVGETGYWWSSTSMGSNAWYRYLFHYSDYVSRWNINPQYGFSVRCVR